MSKNITTYQELIAAKENLKQDVLLAEDELKNNRFLKLSKTIIDGDSLKDPLLESLHAIDLKNILTSPMGKMASTFLLTNKFVRKYFIAFSIIKETVPYAFSKIKEMIAQSEFSKKDNEKQI